MARRPRIGAVWGVLLSGFCLLSAVAQAQVLIGVRWTTGSQLQELGAIGKVRYVAPRVAFVEGDARTVQALESRGLIPLQVDVPRAQDGYFLTDRDAYPNPLHPSLPPEISLVYSDPSGWALLRLPQSYLAEALEYVHFLWPLPEQYSLQGWRPSRAKLAAVQATSVTHLISEVDEARLRTHVEALALKDPALGSAFPDNWRTRYARRPETIESTNYIRDQLAADLGVESVVVEPFRINGTDSTMYNVVGNLSGTDLEAGYYVICAHYDAIGVRTRGGWDWRKDPAPGADDNATGVALVLESARILAGHPFPWSIRFIAFSGEELGLWGSRAYASQAVERGERILGVLNFDMVGFNDLSQRLELVTNPASRWLVEQMRQCNRRYGIGLKVDVLEDEFAGLSDHAPFWARGFDAILGIENYLPTDSTTAGVRNGEYRINTQYHSILDLPDSVNYELVARTTRLTIATLAQYGLEEGLPDLAVFTGDLHSDAQDDLQVRISNVGVGQVVDPFRVRVWRCGADSTGCEMKFDQQQVVPLAPGAALDLSVPWDGYGETVFLVEVDPDKQVVEQDEENNRAFQQVRLVPHQKIAVFPNPFRPGQDPYLSFSGLPLHSHVHIATSQGEAVWSGDEDHQQEKSLLNEVRWRGENEAGFDVSSGVYVYTITAADGKVLERNKIAVAR